MKKLTERFQLPLDAKLLLFVNTQAFKIVIYARYSNWVVFPSSGRKPAQVVEIMPEFFSEQFKYR